MYLPLTFELVLCGRIMSASFARVLPTPRNSNYEKTASGLLILLCIVMGNNRLNRATAIIETCDSVFESWNDLWEA